LRHIFLHQMQKMQKIPFVSHVWNYLAAPNLPGASVAISETHLSLIALRFRKGEFELQNLGVLRMPPGLINASFTEPNVADEKAVIELLKRTSTQAGMDRVKSLSASLPAGSARSVVISLDSVPDNRSELTQMVEWKTERNLGQKIDDLRVSYRRLRDLNGRSQWMVSAAHQAVIGQYERIFAGLGWQVGLIVPQHLGEAQWLLRSGIEEDQVLLSLNARGFEAVIVRGDEPLLVREVICSMQEREDEFYRLMAFYRDRLLPDQSAVPLSRMLTIGEQTEQTKFGELLSSALEKDTVSLAPQHIGLKLDPRAPFNHFAAAGGLATMCWG
jgi:Tfp pilus assembly PilM family ATPase